MEEKNQIEKWRLPEACLSNRIILQCPFVAFALPYYNKIFGEDYPCAAGFVSNIMNLAIFVGYDLGDPNTFPFIFGDYDEELINDAIYMQKRGDLYDFENFAAPYHDKATEVVEFLEEFFANIAIVSKSFRREESLKILSVLCELKQCNLPPDATVNDIIKMFEVGHITLDFLDGEQAEQIRRLCAVTASVCTREKTANWMPQFTKAMDREGIAAELDALKKQKVKEKEVEAKRMLDSVIPGFKCEHTLHVENGIRIHTVTVLDIYTNHDGVKKIYEVLTKTCILREGKKFEEELQEYWEGKDLYCSILESLE